MWNKTTQGKPSSAVPQPAAAATVTPVTAPAAPVPPAVSAPTAPATERSVAPVATGTSRINAGLKIQGEISGSSDLYIDGEMQGKIRLANAQVEIGPNGRIQADIEARGIVIEGSVQGNLKAGESVHLGPASRVQGSVLTPRIGIDDGARLRGKVEMTRADSPPSASLPQSHSPAGSSASTAAPEILRPVAASAKDE